MGMATVKKTGPSDPRLIAYLEQLEEFTYGSFPYSRCVDEDQAQWPARFPDGNLSQLIVNWDSLSSALWQDQLAKSIVIIDEQLLSGGESARQ